MFYYYILSSRTGCSDTLPINLFFDFVKGYTVFFGNVFGIAYTLRRSDENLERTLSVFDTCYQTFNLAVALYGCVHLVKIASQIVHMGIKNRPCADMGSPEAILRANALGTVNINDAFYPVMAPGGCVIDTSSMSAYLAPGFIMPKRVYPLARTDREKFLKKMMARINLMPKNARTGVAYSISKHFVIWFAKTDAARFGAKGVRCLSVTPGNFDTPMGQLESAEAQTFTAHSALKRNGRPEEIAALYALLLDERLGYLTGTDIVMDGGVIASGVSGLSR